MRSELCAKSSPIYAFASALNMHRYNQWLSFQTVRYLFYINVSNLKKKSFIEKSSKFPYFTIWLQILLYFITLDSFCSAFILHWSNYWDFYWLSFGWVVFPLLLAYFFFSLKHSNSNFLNCCIHFTELLIVFFFISCWHYLPWFWDDIKSVIMHSRQHQQLGNQLKSLCSCKNYTGHWWRHPVR